MSEHNEYALRDFLPQRFDGMEQALREGMAKQPSLAWGFVGEEAAKAILSTLDLDVFEILARGWSKARELYKYTDPATYPPGESWIVHLGDHETPTFAVHPILQVAYAAGALGPRLRFTLELSAHFRSVALLLRDGHITAVGAGDGAVRAQLKYGSVALHKQLESKAVNLGRPIRFSEPGIRIARATSNPSSPTG